MWKALNTVLHFIYHFSVTTQHSYKMRIFPKWNLIFYIYNSYTNRFFVLLWWTITVFFFFPVKNLRAF